MIDSGTIQIIHYVITAATTLATAIMGYFLTQKTRKTDDEKEYNAKISQLQLEIAVVRNQIENDKESRSRIYNKLESIEEHLNE